jgi:hypothetical protein
VSFAEKESLKNIIAMIAQTRRPFAVKIVVIYLAVIAIVVKKMIRFGVGNLILAVIQVLSITKN